MSFPQWWKILQTTPLCIGLTQAEGGAVFDGAKERRVEGGELLFEEWQPPDSLYVVLGGIVEVYKTATAGPPVTLAEMGTGAVLGEMSLLGGTLARSASARAKGATAQVLELSNQRFEYLLSVNNLGALKVVLNLARVLSKRLWAMDEKLVAAVDPGKKKEMLSDFQKILTRWSF